MSKLKFALTLALSSIFSSPFVAVASDIPARFEFRGSGYGHGVGMSQVGAYGQALEGRKIGRAHV